MSENSFKFSAPQFVESWENASRIDDGADKFFDAAEDVTGSAERVAIVAPFAAQENLTNEASSTEPLSTIWQSEEGEVRTRQRRASIKRKLVASPYIPLAERIYHMEHGTPKRFRNKTQSVPVLNTTKLSGTTVAQSPFLMTKTRTRPCTAPEMSTEQRPILKPMRRREIGVLFKPIPKPPTIPEPFKLSENYQKKMVQDENKPFVFKARPAPPGLERSYATSCSSSSAPTLKHAKMNKSKMLVATEKGPKCILDNAGVGMKIKHGKNTPTRCVPFSFLERDKERSKKKGENRTKICTNFKAKSPSVLEKDPFFPVLEKRLLPTPNNPHLETEERAQVWERLDEERKEREEAELRVVAEIEKADQEEISKLRRNLTFKARPAPDFHNSSRK